MCCVASTKNQGSSDAETLGDQVRCEDHIGTSILQGKVCFHNYITIQSIDQKPIRLIHAKLVWDNLGCMIK